MILDIIGLSLNLLGTVIAGWRGGMYLKLVNASLNAHELFIATYLNRQTDVVRITGLDEHRENALKQALVGTGIGLVLIAIGFAVQIIGLFLKS